MKQQEIYPVQGRLIRDPATGQEVTAPTLVDVSDPFWARRIGDGDVTLAAAPARSIKKTGKEE